MKWLQNPKRNKLLFSFKELGRNRFFYELAFVISVTSLLEIMNDCFFFQVLKKAEKGVKDSVL